MLQLKNNLSIFALLIFLSYCNVGLKAQAGILDNTFGTRGKVVTSTENNDIFGESVLVQPDGKIIVAGYYKNVNNKDFVVVRYNRDGSLDNTFGNNGKVITDFNGQDDYIIDVALLTDGKIIAGGYIDSSDGKIIKLGIARYNPNGTIDSTFSGDGKKTFIEYFGYRPQRIEDILIQPNGNIIAVGRAQNNLLIIKLDSKGDYDTTFKSKGWAEIPLSHNLDAGTCIALQPDGKIVVAGYLHYTAQSLNFIARFTPNGNLDTSFNSLGINTVEVGAHAIGSPSGITIQKDGKILIVGRTVESINVECALIRLNSNGTLDMSFNGKGTLHHYILNFPSYLTDVLVQPDGKILAIGTAKSAFNSYCAIVRYNNNGSFDSTFNSNGIDTISLGKKYSTGNSIILQPDKKIVIAGGAMDGSNIYNMGVARYFSGIELSIPEYLTTNLKLYPNPANDYITLDYTLYVQSNISIRLIDLQGRTIFSKVENKPKEVGQHKETIDLQSLSKGIYTLIFKTNNNEQSYLIMH